MTSGALWKPEGFMASWGAQHRVSLLQVHVLGFKEQDFKSIFLISSFLILTWRTHPHHHSPAHDTFDGTDVISLQVVVLPQGAGSLVERSVLALQPAQGLVELLILCICLLQVRTAPASAQLRVECVTAVLHQQIYYSRTSTCGLPVDWMLFLQGIDVPEVCSAKCGSCFQAQCALWSSGSVQLWGWCSAPSRRQGPLLLLPGFSREQSKDPRVGCNWWCDGTIPGCPENTCRCSCELCGAGAALPLPVPWWL